MNEFYSNKVFVFNSKMSSNSKKQSTSNPHDKTCVKQVFIPKSNVDSKMGWSQIPFDIAQKNKEEILIHYEKTSADYLKIQGMVTPVVKNSVEVTN